MSTTKLLQIKEPDKITASQ